MRDDEEEQTEAKTVDFGIDAAKWKKWIDARNGKLDDGRAADLSFNQARHSQREGDYFTGDIENDEDFKKWVISRDGSGANLRAQ